mgnify:FL=1
MAQANVKLIVDASNAQKALRGVQKQTNQLQQSFGGLRTAIAGIGFTLLAKQTISTTSNFQALQIRMKVLTSEFGEFAGAQDLVRKAQDKFNLSIVEATKGITDIFARLRPLGISLKDIETVFMGFNTIAKEAGLNATEASAAFTQLAQGLGSGRLQGDEFRSIAEQVPQLLKAISDETNIATGKLKDFASKGLLTTDVILRALAKSADEGADKIEKIMAESPAEVFKEFSNAVLELQLTLGSKLLPAVLEVTKGLSKLVDGITKFIDSEGGQVTLAFIGIAAAIKGITVVAPILLAQIAALKANFLAMSMASAAANGSLATTTTMAFATAGGFTKAAAAATAFKLALAKTGIGLAIISFGVLVTKILEAVNAQKKFNELLETGSSLAIQKEIDDTKKVIEDFEEKVKKLRENMGFFYDEDNFFEHQLKKAREELEKLQARLPITQGLELFREFEKTKKTLEEKNKELQKILERSKLETEEEKKAFDIEQRRLELVEKYGEEVAQILLDIEEENRDLQKGVDKLKEKDEAAKKLAETYQKIGDSIATGISDALTDAVMQTKSLAEVANALLNDIARQLIRLGINTLLFNAFGGASGIFKNLPTFAAGGRPTVGQPSIVGEKGAEIFVPDRAGTIIPNNKIGVGGGGMTNNIVVNVNMEGGVDAQGGEEEGRQLGRLIAVAVQSEIIQQKRAGGLLA